MTKREIVVGQQQFLRNLKTMLDEATGAVRD